MKEPRRVLLLVGSPKASGSTSESLGDCFLARLKDKGFETTSMHINSGLRADEKTAELLLAVDAADVIVFSFPLYVDAVPAGATRALELIAANRKPGRLPPNVVASLRQVVDMLEAEHVEQAIAAITGLIKRSVLPFVVVTVLQLVLRERKVSHKAVAAIKGLVERMDRKKLSILAICNSGFPEASQCDAALAICRQFARESGIEWLGGLALGGGASVHGKPLEKAGGMVRNVRKALDIAAADVAAGKPVSQEAIDLMARPLAPSWLYRVFGNLGWFAQAWQNRTLRRLGARPIRQ